MSRIFPAKVLLFGEYTAISGSDALSIPYERYYGTWVTAEDQQQELFDDLLAYLSEARSKGDFTFDLDLDRMRKERLEGLSFKSDIPVGYGIGSSGAFSAGLFHRFGALEVSEYNSNLNDLRTTLAAIESFFHGRSSGMDPLVSLLNQGLMVGDGSEYKLVEIGRPLEKIGVSAYLLNSKKSRRTSPFVELYNQKLNDRGFKHRIDNELFPLVNGLIGSMTGSSDDIFSRVFELSTLQLHLFPEMIIPGIQAAWRFGLDKSTFAIKLCGAGGGGFYLAFCAHENEEQLLQSTASFDPLKLEL